MRNFPSYNIVLNSIIYVFLENNILYKSGSTVTRRLKEKSGENITCILEIQGQPELYDDTYVETYNSLFHDHNLYICEIVYIYKPSLMR